MRPLFFALAMIATPAIAAPIAAGGSGMTPAQVEQLIPTELSQFDNDVGFITSSALSPYATSAAMTAALAGKQTTLATGASTQYVRGDLTLSTFLTDARAALSVAGSGSYNPSTGVITVNAAGSRTFQYPGVTSGIPARAVGTCFQISITQDAQFYYSVDVTATISSLLSGGQAGTAKIAAYSDSSCSTKIADLRGGQARNTGTLSALLSVAQGTTIALSGSAPKNTWLKVTTANVTDTPTFTMRAEQEEVLLP